MSSGYYQSQPYPPQPQGGYYEQPNSKYSSYAQPQPPYPPGPYAQAPPPPSQPYPPAPSYPTGDVHGGPAGGNPGSGKPEDFAGPKQERFVPNGKWQDLWALVLFYIHLAGYVVMMVLTIPYISFGNLDEIQLSFQEFGDVRAEFIAIGVGAVVSFVGCLLYLFLLGRFPLAMVKMSFFVSIVIFVAFAGVMAYLGSYVSAIISAVLALFFILTYRAFRARMGLVALLIRTIVEVADKWKGVYVMSMAQALVEFIHATSFLAVLIGGLQRWYIPPTSVNGQGTIDAAYYAVALYSVFSLYWTQQVIKNVGHVTLGGVFASFYFLSPSVSGSSTSAPPHGPGMPRFPTFGALKRAMTTSFGSIAFGSLVIAVLQFIRFLIRQVAYQSDGPLVFLACCVDCILGCIEGLVEFFNEYAFAQVAIYGKPYIRAAKDTWNLLKTRGLDVVLQENLTNAVLMVGGFIIAGLGIAAAFIVAVLQNVDVTKTTSLILLIVIPLIIGMVLFGVVGVVIDSGVATTFVALAEEPDALYRTKPDLYHEIQRAFPSITVPVSGIA